MKNIKKLFATRELRILLAAMAAIVGIGCAYEHITGRTIDPMFCAHVGGGMSVCSK